MENKYRCWIKNEGFIIERICVARSIEVDCGGVFVGGEIARW